MPAPLFLKVAAVAMSGMLFPFLVKALFKRQRWDDPLLMEVREAEHPELFAFLRRLCVETGAPFPHRVFLHPEVNASVFYNSSLLNLIFPVRKNLMIGLGLPNALPLSEFKGVLAHEFGHFSQNSMRLGQYVYVSNRIIGDMVHSRDFFDDLLQRWKKLGDLRLSGPGWLLSGLVWVLRKFLTLVFHGINWGQAALSREMEFHADLVAVSVSGSDVIPNLLKRLEAASHGLMSALEDLKSATHHRLYTRHLFHHQTHAIAYLRGVRRDPQWGIPPEQPADPTQYVRVFDPGDEGVPDMYASHPPNSQREANARARYFRSPTDDRSPWVLFRSPEVLREAMTRRFYEVNASLEPGTPLADPEEVQRFIDGEHAETTYDPRYCGLYDGRLIQPGGGDDLPEMVREPWDRERIGAAFRRLYEEGIKEFAEAHLSRRAEQDVLQKLESGEYSLRKATFTFREQEHRKKDVPDLLQRVQAELEQDEAWLKGFDADVFLAHYHAAREVDGSQAEELLSRYRFHLAAQEIAVTFQGQFQRLEHVIGYVQKNEGVPEGQFPEVLRHFREARAEAEGALNRAGTLALPALSNMEAGSWLGAFILAEPLVEDLPEDAKELPGEWVSRLMSQLHDAREKSGRVHFKSLGGILALQERVATAWRGEPLPESGAA